MPAPAGGKVLITRQNQPRRKSVRVAVGRAGKSQYASRVERVSENPCHPYFMVALLRRPDRHNGVSEVRRPAEVERRMGIENLETAYQQDCDAEHADPMGQADDDRVPVDKRRSTRRGGKALIRSRQMPNHDRRTGFTR